MNILTANETAMKTAIGCIYKELSQDLIDNSPAGKGTIDDLLAMAEHGLDLDGKGES
ncbi:MAG: hypothetical protein FWG87_14685 [Defluviitaleaceae bacterium]|nr:hypothetical protein [Defluviitaleaceae bacterium]